MSQQNKGDKTSAPVELPMKRKRGRPRKEETLVQEEKTQDAEINPDSDINDEMVGQAVSGVLQGAFDAGYFLTVKVDNTDTLLSGVVFQPGLIAPITAANDVAPHVKMYRRAEIPFPDLNLQTQLNSFVQQRQQDNKLPYQLEKKALTVPEQVLPSSIHSGITPAIENQSTPVLVSLTDNMPKIGTSLSIGGHGKPHQTSDFGQENQSASVAQLESDIIVKQDGMLQKFEATIPGEGLKIHVGEFSGSVSEPSSGPSVNMLSGNETINQVPQAQDHPKNYTFNLNELVSSEVKSPNFEVHQAPVVTVTECSSVPPEVISMQIDIPMERDASPKNSLEQDINSDLSLKISSRDDISQFSERPVGDAASIGEERFQSEVKTSQLIMNFQGANISDELKLAAEGSNLPGETVPQIPTSGGPAANDMDCEVEDAIPPT